MDESNNPKLVGSLIRSEREALGWSQSRLAEAAGTNQQTIEKIELGKTKKSSYLPKIAQVLAIDLPRLLPDLAKGPQSLIPERDVRGDVEDLPVYTAAEGGAGELIVSTDPIDWVLRPTPLARVAKAYGIVIVGDSMSPEFEPGDVALINPNLPPVAGHTYVFYSEGNGEARATIKRLLRASNGSWHVRQHNPKKDLTLGKAEWQKAHRVVSKNYR